MQNVFAKAEKYICPNSSFDEKRYTSAIVEPPVPKLYFAQMDALNDCLVIENLANVCISTLTTMRYTYKNVMYIYLKDI